MRFRITPTSKNICATRQVYRKGNQEITFGEIFTDFELITANHKDWIKSYSSELGVCLDDIDCIDSNFNSDSINPVIFFSETTPSEERQKLTKLFKRNKDSLYAFENAISNLNWNYVESKSYFWGDIKIEKYFGSPESQKLLKKINLIIDKSRDEIISECEYMDDDDIDYLSFYEDLLYAIGLVITWLLGVFRWDWNLGIDSGD